MDPKYKYAIHVCGVDFGLVLLYTLHFALLLYTLTLHFELYTSVRYHNELCFTVLLFYFKRQL